MDYPPQVLDAIAEAMRRYDPALAEKRRQEGTALGHLSQVTAKQAVTA